MRRVFFGSSDGALGDFAQAILRVFTGLTMALAHGLPKFPPGEQLIGGLTHMGFPLPELFAWLAVGAELLGGLLLCVGFLTRPAAAFLAITMLVAAVMVHGADPFQKKEMALLYFFISFFFTLKGAGKFSIDHFIRQK
jgi:putative oxidoreductase